MTTPRPAVPDNGARGSNAVRDLVDRMFGGSTDELVMSLIKSRQIDAKRLAELSRRVQQQAEEEEKQGGGA